MKDEQTPPTLQMEDERTQPEFSLHEVKRTQPELPQQEKTPTPAESPGPAEVADDLFLSSEHVAPIHAYLPPQVAQEEEPAASPAPEDEGIPTLELPLTWEVEAPDDAPQSEAADEEDRLVLPEPEELPQRPTPLGPEANILKENAPAATTVLPLEPPTLPTPEPAVDAPTPSPKPQEAANEASPTAAAETPAPPPTPTPPPPSGPAKAPMGPPLAQIPVDFHRFRRTMVLDTAVGCFRLHHDQLEPISPGHGAQRWCLWLYDGPSVQGPGVIRVDAPAKYAHLMAQRQLQRSGDLTDDAVFTPLTIRRLGKKQTLLAYRTIARSEHARLLATHERSAEGALLHDAGSLLVAYLASYRSQAPQAAILHLPGSLTAIVVQGRHVLWGRRQMLAAESGPLWEDAARNLRAEMDHAAREGGWQLSEVLWIVGLSSSRDLPPGGFTPLPVSTLHGPEGESYSALPGISTHLGFGPSLTPVPDRLAAALRPWEPWAYAAAMLMGLMLVGIGFLLKGQGDQFLRQGDLWGERKAALFSELNRLQAQTQFPPELLTQAQTTWTHAQEIRRAESSPPLAGVWNQLAELKPGACRVLSLEMAYDGPILRLTLTGGIELPMSQAQAVFNLFVRDLREAGFEPTTTDLRFDLDGNAFTLVLEKPLEN